VTGTGRAGAATGAGAGAGEGGGTAPGGVVQPAAASRVQAMIAATDGERLMWVIYLEAGVAIVLVLFIVWWTMRGKK
jgi:hypothetical protein